MTGSAALGRIDHLRSLRRYADAEQELRAALADTPQDVELLWRLASVLLQLERHEEGLAAANAAIAADPNDPDGYRFAALLLCGLGRAQEAVHAGWTCVSLRPDHHAAAMAYAAALQSAGRLADAVLVARRAVALAPHEPSTHLMVAGMLAAAGDWATARLAYQETLRLDPANAMARQGLARQDLRDRRPGRALGGLVAAGRLDPQLDSVLDDVAALLWQLSWRLRIGLVVAVLVVFVPAAADAAGPSWTTRIIALLVIAATAAYTWRAARSLPAGTRPVVMAALRGDRLLHLTWIVIAGCLAVYLAVAVTGLGALAVLVWPAMVLLNVLAIVSRLRRRRQA